MATCNLHCKSIDDDGEVCDAYNLDYYYDIKDYGIIFVESGNFAHRNKRSTVCIPHVVFDKMIKDYDKFKNEHKENQ